MAEMLPLPCPTYLKVFRFHWLLFMAKTTLMRSIQQKVSCCDHKIFIVDLV